LKSIRILFAALVAAAVSIAACSDSAPAAPPAPKPTSVNGKVVPPAEVPPEPAVVSKTEPATEVVLIAKVGECSVYRIRDGSRANIYLAGGMSGASSMGCSLTG